MEKIKKGNLILVNVAGENQPIEPAKAKILKDEVSNGKITVLLKGRIKLIDKESVIGPAEKLSFNSSKQENTLSEIQINILSFLSEEKEIEFQELSNKTGLHKIQLKSALKVITDKQELIIRVDDEKTYFTLKGKKEFKKRRANTKTDIDKATRVLNLHKAQKKPAEIAELIESPIYYVKEIIKIYSEKMPVPDEGTTKREMFDMLKNGESCKKISKIVDVSYTYVNKFRRRMMASGHI